MGISERKEREREQRRNDIIDAAEKVIFSKHLDASTMDEIAEEAELSKGTLYLYFKNKTELFLAIQERGLSMLVDDFRKTLKNSGSKVGLDLIHDLGETYFKFSVKYPNYYNADVYGRSQEFLDEVKNLDMSKACNAKRALLMSALQTALQKGVDDGSIRNDIDPKRMSLQLYASFFGIIQVHQTRKRAVLESIMELMDIDTEIMIYEYFDLIRRGLKS